MDEEDGRPGPGARQFGAVDVLKDASLESCTAFPVLTAIVPFPIRPAICFYDTPVRIQENRYENVPGK